MQTHGFQSNNMDFANHYMLDSCPLVRSTGIDVDSGKAFIWTATLAQTDKEINAYLGDYILNHKTSSLKVADLKQYLQYIGFGKDIR